VEIEVIQGAALLGLLPASEHILPYSFPLEPGRASFRFTSRTADSGHGLKLEELRFVSGGLGALLPDLRSILLASSGAVLLAGVFVLAGFSSRASALLATLGLGLPLAGLDPFASLHWLSKAAIVSSLLSLFFVPLFRTRSKWWKLIPVSTLIAASFALFHPSYYFKDVDIHREVTDVARSEGPRELWSRMDYYQELFGLGRASLEGRRRPMPYPPVLHTLAALVPFGATEDVLKWSGIALYALIVALVMLLAGRVTEVESAALAAGALGALFPDGVLELLRASYPALLGQLALLVLVLLVMRYAGTLRSTQGVLAFGALIAACALVYNAGPLTLAVFLPLLFAAFAMPPSLPGSAGLLAAAIVGSIPGFAFYGSFLLDLLRAPGGRGEESLAERFDAATVGWDVFGPLYLALSLAGVFLAAKHRDRLENRVLLAWTAYALAISIPVFLAPEPLYYFRRLFFVYPLVPILTVLALSRRKWLLAAAALGLAAWSLHRATDFIVPFYVTHTGSLAPPS
jgi:hypothetical protein